MRMQPGFVVNDDGVAIGGIDQHTVGHTVHGGAIGFSDHKIVMPGDWAVIMGNLRQAGHAEFFEDVIYICVKEDVDVFFTG